MLLSEAIKYLLFHYWERGLPIKIETVKFIFAKSNIIFIFENQNEIIGFEDTIVLINKTRHNIVFILKIHSPYVANITYY